MQAAGDIFATAQAASTLADVGEAWRLSPDLGAALLAGDCLQLLQGDPSRLSLFSAVMCCTACKNQMSREVCFESEGHAVAVPPCNDELVWDFISKDSPYTDLRAQDPPFVMIVLLGL